MEEAPIAGLCQERTKYSKAGRIKLFDKFRKNDYHAFDPPVKATVQVWEIEGRSEKYTHKEIECHILAIVRMTCDGQLVFLCRGDRGYTHTDADMFHRLEKSVTAVHSDVM